MTMEKQPVESMYLPLDMVIFRCHVSFRGCNNQKNTHTHKQKTGGLANPLLVEKETSPV